MRHLLASALIAVAALTLACGGPTPPPTTAPSSAPASPGPDGSPGVIPSPSFAVDLDAVAELPPQPAIPGLYLPAGVLAQGTDHHALIQARMDCPTLKAVLGAGQWLVADRAQIVIPTTAPGQSPVPLPEFSLPEWLLLRWGDETAVARVGGDENGCMAQVWRLPNAAYSAHGAIESEGTARQLQVQCIAGSGIAELGLLYFAGDGTFFSLSTSVPLTLGTHSIAQDSELSAGSGPTIDMAFRIFYGGVSDEPDMPGIQSYFPVDPSTGTWPGSIEVTGLDPLTGVITFDGVRNEAGETLHLQTEFRCDLPSGQLTRAAEEAANATPSPAPSASPAPGQVTVEIASGPHAGTHEAVSSEATCSLSLFGEGSWLISYSASEPVQGELQSLLLTVPEDGGKSDVTMFFGDDFEDDWFNTSDATANVQDNGTSVEFTVTGHAAASDFTINFVCFDVARF